MSIASMTGFARSAGEFNTDLHNICWQFEIKSVNGKVLDIKTKLPLQYDDLSFELKRIAAKYLQRGNVSVFLELQNTKSDATPQINQEFLYELTNKALDLYRSYSGEVEKPRSSELLAMRGVVEIVETPLSDEDECKLRTALLEDFENLCKKLCEDRRKEGEKIKQALVDILQQINTIVSKVEKIAETLPEKIRAKLEEQLKIWLGDASISEDRLAQEVVFYVTKADIKEEIDRLKAHLKSAREFLDSSDAVGRRLDFLCQELNREANTTCSKSSDIELTACGMELKALIEQFREQVQNIE